MSATPEYPPNNVSEAPAHPGMDADDLLGEGVRVRSCTLLDFKGKGARLLLERFACVTLPIPFDLKHIESLRKEVEALLQVCNPLRVLGDESIGTIRRRQMQSSLALALLKLLLQGLAFAIESFESALKPRYATYCVG